MSLKRQRMMTGLWFYRQSLVRGLSRFQKKTPQKTTPQTLVAGTEMPSGAGTSSDQQINAAAGHEAVLRGVCAKVPFLVYTQCRHDILYGVHEKNAAPMILAAMSDTTRASRL